MADSEKGHVHFDPEKPHEFNVAPDKLDDLCPSCLIGMMLYHGKSLQGLGHKSQGAVMVEGARRMLNMLIASEAFDKAAEGYDVMTAERMRAELGRRFGAQST